MNALFGKAGAYAGKPKAAQDVFPFVHSVGNVHGIPFIENRVFDRGEGKGLYLQESVMRFLSWTLIKVEAFPVAAVFFSSNGVRDEQVCIGRMK